MKDTASNKPNAAMETAPVPPLSTSTKSKVPKRKLAVLTGLGVAGVIVVLVFATLFILWQGQRISTTQGTDDQTNVRSLSAKQAFSDVQIQSVSVTPTIPVFNIQSDLSNISNVARFNFNDAVKSKLAANNFVVVEPIHTPQSRAYDEFHPVYESNRYNRVPNFITSDALLHAYHLIFDDVLKSLEQAVFFEKLKVLASHMQAQSQTQYDQFAAAGDMVMQDAALRNVAYFAVANALLQSDVAVPEYAKSLVDAELALISQAGDIQPSPIMNLGADVPVTVANKEDYTQYIPRGHYTKTQRLTQYFKTMMWLGRITFRQKSESENLSAILISLALQQDTEALTHWSDIYDTTSFMIGNSDDLGVYEYSQVITDTLGEGSTLETLLQEGNAAKVIEEIKLLQAPQINSMPIFDATINPDREAEIKGFRVMGQRYTLDADVFQRLVYRDVEETDGMRRMLPKSLDLLAAMGSAKAETLLQSQGDFTYSNYGSNLEALKAKIAGFEENYWTRNLYSGWLYMLKPLTLPVAEGYPAFMRNDGWLYKDLNTYQASWTELKHDTVLYTKQIYAEMGGGNPQFVLPDDRGYIEPRPDIYTRLKALVEMTLDGLNSRGLLEGLDYSFTETPAEPCPPYVQSCDITYKFKGEEITANLTSLSDMVTKSLAISIKELQNEAITEDEYNFIKEIGGQLEHLWFVTQHLQTNHQPTINEALNNNPVMLVSDVATDPNGQVLQEGLGRLMEIYVVIPLSGGDKPDYYRIAKGVVFSQYEFVQPISARLTDEKWRTDIRNGTVPELAGWKLNYIVPKTEVEVASMNLIMDEWTGNNDEEKRNYCEQTRTGTFEQCGNVCPEENMSCGLACKPICRFY